MPPGPPARPMAAPGARGHRPGDRRTCGDPRRVEDVVIILGRVELDQLRDALQNALGDEVERPNTPARLERALSLASRAPRRAGPTQGPPPARRRLDPGVLGDPPRRCRPGDQHGRSRREPDRRVRRMIGTSCLQCGTPSDNGRGTFCRRCGLPYGQPPRADRRAAELPDLLPDRGRRRSPAEPRPAGHAGRPGPSPGRARLASGR